MNKCPAISVVIPCYNVPLDHLKSLYKSLVEQRFENFEVVLVDDCSIFNYYELIKDSRFSIVYQAKNAGPATARNIGAEKARSENLFFTDSDCTLAPDTLEKAHEALKRDHVSMGDTITTAKTYFGKSVGYLGFPGGGLLGFHNVWRVDDEGYATSVSSCNLAITKFSFEKCAKFDTTFPVPGGEDTVFAKTILKNGFRIKYSSDQIVYHVEREDWSGFIRWQNIRGRGNYHIRRKLDKVNGFLKLRVWSFYNSLKAAGPRYGLFVAFLIVISTVYQSRGYALEKKRFLEK